MNIIWLLITLVTILYCLMTGNVDITNDVFLSVGKEALDFMIPPLCVTCFWNGILYIARNAKIAHGLERLFHPLLKRLFSDLRNDKEILDYVTTNVVVNTVGLGSAAAPVGLQVMKGMQRQNPDKDTTSRSMVTFPVLDTAGVTLLSTTLIALRASFHPLHVTGFMPYTIVSMLFASIVGLSINRWRSCRG